MRKIVLYVPNIMPGGAERVMVNLANYFAKTYNCKIFLMTRYGGTYDNLVLPNVNRINLTGSNVISLIPLLRSIKPDIIMSTLDSANIRLMLLKMFLRTKTLFIARSPNICYSWKFQKTIKEKVHCYLGNISYRLADYAISNSPDTELSMLTVCHVKKEKVFTIGNPVFYLSDLRDRTLIRPTDVPERYILAVGRFQYQKRYDLMIEVFRILSEKSDVHLCILGDDKEQRPMMEDKIRKYGLENRIHLLGIRKDVSNYYYYAECFLHCAEFEGFGNVFVEALSNGLVPVCFNSPGGPNYILDNGKYGILIPFAYIREMADAVLQVLNKKVVFDKNALIERAKSFSIEVKGKEYYDLLVQLYRLKYQEDF